MEVTGAYVVSMWVVTLLRLYRYSYPPLHCHPPS